MLSRTWKVWEKSARSGGIALEGKEGEESLYTKNAISFFEIRKRTLQTLVGRFAVVCHALPLGRICSRFLEAPDTPRELANEIYVDIIAR